MEELHSHNFLIGNVYGYNSESLNNLLITDIEDNINLLIHKYPSAKVILGGDVNMVLSQ